MKIALSMIRSFLETELSPSQIAETLTLLGIEVDRIHNEHPFSGVVAGQVNETTPHPKADKLRVAQVSDGTKNFQVVCGAPNCRPGIIVPFAKPGALLAKAKHIESCEIRGVLSLGMLCSDEELGLPSLQDGILELPSETKPGVDLASLLWDPIFEISLTPNLGHCMSALGLARELSAALQIPLKQTKTSRPKLVASKEAPSILIADKELCPRYLCQQIEDATIAPSPFWLQRQLIASGIHPISNAVDVSNYILLKRGQPLHIFDADKLQGKQIRIQTSKESVPFLGLDGVNREIPPGTLLIYDQNRPVAIAGILGGENSAVTTQTKNLFIEAAVFAPANIRKTGKQLGLRTESSQRFEKGIDPNGVKEALEEAAALIFDLCQAKAIYPQVEEGSPHFPSKKILCRPHRVNGLLGTKISLSEMEDIFHRLGFKTTQLSQEAIDVSVPPFRSDVSEEIDLIEEIGRIYGYNHIERKNARFSASPVGHDPAYLLECETRKRLIALGLQEFLNADLISPKLADLAKEWVHPEAQLLKALSPKTEEYSILRPSLLPGMMQAAANNFAHKTFTFGAFELGNIHFLQKEELIEQPMAAILLAGKNSPPHWSKKAEETDFFDLKGLLENLLEALHIRSNISFCPSSHPSFHPKRQANLLCNDQLIGSLGQIHPTLLGKLDIERPLLYAELNLKIIQTLRNPQIRMHPLPKYPSSERDWTVALPSHFIIQTLFSTIGSIRPPLLEKAELIDLYTPESSSHKNASFRFTYRDLTKTISFEEVEKEHRSLIEMLEKSLQTSS